MKRYLFAIVLTSCGAQVANGAAPAPDTIPVGTLPPMVETIEAPVEHHSLESAVRLDPPIPTTTTMAVIETGFGLTPGDCEQYVPLLIKYGIDVAWGKRIMNRESLCLFNVHNGRLSDDSYGLFQINTKGNNWAGHLGVQMLCGVTDKAQLFDPETNIACAKAMLDTYGTKPWQT
jgi:hypothetical protein